MMPILIFITLVIFSPFILASDGFPQNQRLQKELEEICMLPEILSKSLKLQQLNIQKSENIDNKLTDSVSNTNSSIKKRRARKQFNDKIIENTSKVIKSEKRRRTRKKNL